MKTTPSSSDEEIIELLKRLGTLKVEYPADLLAARRAAFSARVEEQRVRGARAEELFSQERVIELLEELRPAVLEYPPDLLAARRGAFIAQIAQHHNGHSPQETAVPDPVVGLLGNLKSSTPAYPADLLASRREAFIAQIRHHNRQLAPAEGLTDERVIELLGHLKAYPAEYPADLRSVRRSAYIEQIERYRQRHAGASTPSREEVVKLLGSLGSAQTEYPSEMLASRRAAFLAQIERHNREVEKAPLASSSGGLFSILGRLRSIEMEYPLRLFSARRAAFVTQIRDGKMSVLEALRSAVRNFLTIRKTPPTAPKFAFGRTSMVLATLLLAAFVGSLALGNRGSLTGILQPANPQSQVSHPSPFAAATSTAEVAKVICKPGYQPPLCLSQEADQSQDLSFPGNGSARPAVAKDTLPGYSRIHDAAFANDGVYGPGASWISNSAYSWIKIDLGEVRTINTITFGRDRLGTLNDGDPGQFLIGVALSDDIYADGVSTNDFMEYTTVYNSEEVGFDGIISGPETIEARFEPVQARYVKIIFENAGTAVDEIEAFMLQPPGFASNPTQRPRDTLVPPSFTPVPTNTLVPSHTPTPVPTNTLIPTRTPSLTPTNTLVPTHTPFPTFTNTPRPTSTDLPTSTPVPPTSTPVPTDTPVPPSSTPEPPPSNTAEPSTATAGALAASTETPEIFLP